ncbi:MAG: hypothetical protein E8A46_13945 [Bradyrhizobium sp.]|uniref:hypothetical protein n=1 Tax=Bradyrhizobium sp. TaxID=376 RepID=UPI00122B1C40|nr:hypothetical protein [Bradyrhizobium sp.]THD52028.1 MAG: hypothetical protein E8A46_13945 [Bradyrhizobium sp.]
MVHIDLNIKRGLEQQRFLDYLNSRLSPRMSTSRGAAGFSEDGTFESVVTGPFSIDEDQIELSWAYRKSADGELLYIEIQEVLIESGDVKWEDAVHKLVIGALTSALELKRNQFFYRNVFNYVGPQLDGEYWFGQTRFAPVWPEDDQPMLLNAERVVCIDQMVSAIDQTDAWALANQSSARLAARLSLLLDKGLYRPPMEQRWVHRPGDAKSIRGGLVFNGYGVWPTVLPRKGESCKPGQWAGTLTERYSTLGFLSLPKEARRVLRVIDAASPAISESFDRASRLYQIASVLAGQFPSVSLAYRVAAVEALSKSDPSTDHFSEFMRKNVSSVGNLDPILKFLYGTARSGHFHAGEFPLGEYDLSEFPRALMSSDYIANSHLRRISFAVTREAIINWLVARLPISDDEDHD